jgi:histidinol dehydrogenase
MGLEQILFSFDDADFEDKLVRLEAEHSMAGFLKGKADVAESVRKIVERVGRDGDAALSEFGARFDKVELGAGEFAVSREEIKKAHEGLDAELLGSIRKSIENVKKYQAEIFIGDKNAGAGIKYRALRRAALCIPGASAPLPSTVIMTAVPAIVAGVEQVVVISPPRFEGSIHPVILGVCYELGIEEVYRVGGAHAVAAMAWGTETIGKVDIIVGPGNDYVQLAKKEVVGLVKIDSFAGPSDVIIIADDTAKPAWVAADMLSQAEHNPGAAILITTSGEVAERTVCELERQVLLLDRGEVTRECLLKYSAVVRVSDMGEALALCDRFAAEHLEVHCADSRAVAEKVRNAGAIFIGENTPVAVGDYFAGPSHTLPTRQGSRFFSALTCNDFIKSSSLIEYDSGDLKAAAEHVVRLANIEGLTAHANSVRIRIEGGQKG